MRNKKRLLHALWSVYRDDAAAVRRQKDAYEALPILVVGLMRPERDAGLQTEVWEGERPAAFQGSRSLWRLVQTHLKGGWGERQERKTFHFSPIARRRQPQTVIHMGRQKGLCGAEKKKVNPPHTHLFIFKNSFVSRDSQKLATCRGKLAAGRRLP